MNDRQGFWRRQFAPETTARQRTFDILFGILAPIFCVVADPIVFRTSGFGHPWIPYATGAYIFIGLEILTLTAWLAIPRKSPLLSLALAGPLLAGGLAAMGLGIRMLPLSLLGLLAIIGILGFTPFATGFVYLRNGLRAWRSLRGVEGYPLRREVAAAFAFLTMGIVVGGQWASDRSMSLLIADPDSDRARLIVRFLGGNRTDDIVSAWEKEKDPARKGRLAKLYFELTGTGIEDRQSMFRD